MLNILVLFSIVFDSYIDSLAHIFETCPRPTIISDRLKLLCLLDESSSEDCRLLVLNDGKLLLKDNMEDE
jgi:hypothetical protein